MNLPRFLFINLEISGKPIIRGWCYQQKQEIWWRPKKNIGVNSLLATDIEVNIKDQSNDPKLIKAILSLPPGQISAPIELKGEYWLISVSSRKGLITLPLSYAKEEITRVLQSQKEKQITAHLLEGMTTKYPVEKNNILQYLSSTKTTDYHL